MNWFKLDDGRWINLSNYSVIGAADENGCRKIYEAGLPDECSSIRLTENDMKKKLQLIYLGSGD